MAKPKNGNATDSGNVFRFNLTGLIVFSLCLSAGSVFLGAKMFGSRQPDAGFSGRAMLDPKEESKYSPSRQGPWGELFTQDISLERPVEYLNVEMKDVQAPVWTFHGMNLARVKALFTANGLPQEEAEKALAPDRVSVRGADTVLKPSDEFLFSLRPETRARLYEAMKGLDVNLYLDSPYYYSTKGIELVYEDARVHPDDLTVFKKLVYGGKDGWRFSDIEALMGRIPTLDRRVAMTASLSRQAAVIAGLRIRPDTDIDKVAAYWGHLPNVRFIDVRPMVEALKRLSNGGAMSLMYVLPPFARDRLYTYPLPPGRGERVTDCHWSTFNFTNVKPDDRFLDPAQCLQYIDENFYKIAQPGVYGDVLLFRDGTDKIRHSAVYLADDLVFTKNGQNYTMPWMMMRIPDLHAMYSSCQIIYLRRKTE